MFFYLLVFILNYSFSLSPSCFLNEVRDPFFKENSDCSSPMKSPSDNLQSVFDLSTPHAGIDICVADRDMVALTSEEYTMEIRSISLRANNKNVIDPIVLSEEGVDVYIEGGEYPFRS